MIAPFFWVSCDGNCTLCLLLLLAKWSLITSADLRLLLIIRRTTSYWETAAAWFFKSKSIKLALKYLKICSAKPKFFRSSTWNPFSISWHYPINIKNIEIAPKETRHVVVIEWQQKKTILGRVWPSPETTGSDPLPSSGSFYYTVLTGWWYSMQTTCPLSF
jgi:hypothetical protein